MGQLRLTAVSFTFPAEESLHYCMRQTGETGVEGEGEAGVDKNKAGLLNTVKTLFRAMFRSDDFVLASELTNKHAIAEHLGLEGGVLEGWMTASGAVCVRWLVHLYVSLPHSLTSTYVHVCACELRGESSLSIEVWVFGEAL